MLLSAAITSSSTTMPRAIHRDPNSTAGYSNTANAPATNTHAITRFELSAISSISTVSASADMMTSADRTETSTSEGRADDTSTGGSPETSVMTRTITM